MAVECIGNKIFVLDAVAGRIDVLSLTSTVRSDSYRICHSNKRRRISLDPAEAGDSSSGDIEHWLRVLYHMYEKFPASGLITSANDNSKELRLRISTANRLSEEATRACGSFVGAVMQDLCKLNKSLGSVDLARDINFVDDTMTDAVDGWKALAPMPLREFSRI